MKFITKGIGAIFMKKYIKEGGAPKETFIGKSDENFKILKTRVEQDIGKELSKRSIRKLKKIISLQIESVFL